MGMFQKIAQYVKDTSDGFIRGGNRSAQPATEAVQQHATTVNKSVDPQLDTDPFGHNRGNRQPYNSQPAQPEKADEAAQQPVYSAQPEQVQQNEQQAQYTQEQYAQQQAQYAQQQAQYAQQQAQYTQAQYAQQQAQYAQQQAQYAQQQAQQPQQHNVITFPGMQTAPDGFVYAHEEHIVQVANRSECTKVIDIIRTNASVFLNMEAITNPNDRQRCIDLLSGASYALGCTLTRISPNGTYLISSPSVKVVPDNATKLLNGMPVEHGFARQSYEEEKPTASFTAQQAAPEVPAEPQRTGSFSSGSPTQRFQSQGAQGMSLSFGTAMAGSLTGTYRAVQARRYNAQ